MWCDDPGYLSQGSKPAHCLVSLPRTGQSGNLQCSWFSSVLIWVLGLVRSCYIMLHHVTSCYDRPACTTLFSPWVETWSSTIGRVVQQHDATQERRTAETSGGARWFQSHHGLTSTKMVITWIFFWEVPPWLRNLHFVEALQEICRFICLPIL